MLKHLRFAVQHLTLVSESAVYTIDDEAFELVDQITGLLLELTNPGSHKKCRDHRSLRP